jgi:uncharacterized protein YndB with AHSA1/START domain
METEQPIGLTKAVGFEIGVSKAIPIAQEKVWDFMFSEEGAAIWLGHTNWSEFEVNKTYQTTDGIEGVIRVFKPMSHIRLTWKHPEWEAFSTLQVRVMAARDKTRISFHQEKLISAEQRTAMKEYWERVMKALECQLIPSPKQD